MLYTNTQKPWHGENKVFVELQGNNKRKYKFIRHWHAFYFVEWMA